MVEKVEKLQKPPKKQKPRRDDPMVKGFRSQFGTDPLKYITDPETRKRPGEGAEPNGSVVINLEDGPSQYTTLPPIKIWEEGQWVESETTGRAAHPTWRVSGEGTPGNYLHRDYVLPYDYSHDELMNYIPPHPMEWPKKEKPKWGGSYSTTSLPLGLRIRCPLCGHWFRMDDLKGHGECCASNPQATLDWAVACECCPSLDDTVTVKPGFPRAPKEPANGGSDGTT